MRVGFYSTATSADAPHYQQAGMLLQSLRRWMPGVPVSQFTDELSPAVADVDDVRRLPAAPMAQLRPLHWSRSEGEWLFLDTDIIVRRDVAGVFDERFDIALADRNWTHMEPTPGLTRKMPYNAGVAFSRCPTFWRYVYDEVMARPHWAVDFMGDQRAIALVLGKHPVTFDLEVLPGMVYNYPPNALDDRGIFDAAIVHFKGSRKAWMRPGL